MTHKWEYCHDLCGPACNMCGRNGPIIAKYELKGINYALQKIKEDKIIKEKRTQRKKAR